MNERLSLQDLIDLLAKKQEMTKKDAEVFLRELVAVISESIENNESVKIKDFGTFRLVKVNSRKSVDVTTGEAIEIAAHYKLGFNPDKSLKEAVNRPFAHFESVVLEEGVTFDNVENDVLVEGTEEDATIEDDAAEYMPAIPLAEPHSEVQAVSEDADVEDDRGELENRMPEQVPDTIPAGIRDEIEKEATLQSIDMEDVVPVLLKENSETESESVEPAASKKGERRKYARWGLPALVVIALVVIGCLYCNKITGFFKGLSHSDVETETINKPAVPQTKENDIVIDTVRLVDSAKVQPMPKVPDMTTKVPADKPLGTETISPGHTLRNIALKHYGNKSFWVYIYEENRDKIKNPNNVPLGTVLIMPAPAKYGIDSQDAESVRKARKIEEKLFSQLANQ